MFKKIVITSIFFALISCASESNTSNPVQNVVCDCPSGNITANSNDLIGLWKLNKRTILDVTGTNVTEVQDLTTLQPCDENSFSIKAFLNSSNNRIMSIPVGALISPYPHTCSQIVNLEFPIVYYEDGSSCLKLLSTSENAGHKLCLMEFTTTSLKIKMKWSDHYYIFECTKI